MIALRRQLAGLALPFALIAACSATTFRQNSFEIIRLDEREIGASWVRFTDHEYDLVIFVDPTLIAGSAVTALDARTAIAAAQKVSDQLCGWNTKPDLNKNPQPGFVGKSYAYRVICIPDS